MSLHNPRPEESVTSLASEIHRVPLGNKPFIFTTIQELRAGFKSKSLLDSFNFAWQGLCYTAKTQRNFRIHLAISALTLVIGVYTHVSLLEWAILCGVIGVVLFAELINTAIELFVDMLTEGRYDERAKTIKDTAAAAVLLTALMASCVGAFIFIPHLLK